MIVKNEEAVLSRVLGAAKCFADEIVVVDTGSTDRTKEVAHTFTDKVYDFEWCDDFSAARNFAFEKATKPYLMWLDADDVIDDENIVKLLRFKADDTLDADFYYLHYHTAFDAANRPTMTYYRERIMKNCASARFLDPVHEAVPPFGRTAFLDIAVRHQKAKAATGRNLRIYEKYKKSGGIFSPRMRFYYARELMYNGKYRRAKTEFERFLSGGGGWIENELAACKDLSCCYVQLGRGDLAVLALLHALTLCPPRADILCELGALLAAQNKPTAAAYWYEAALNAPRVPHSLGFESPDCYDFIPALNLCVIYYHLGDTAKAAHFNELAGAAKPDHPSYLYNKAFFHEKRDLFEKD